MRGSISVTIFRKPVCVCCSVHLLGCCWAAGLLLLYYVPVIHTSTAAVKSIALLCSEGN